MTAAAEYIAQLEELGLPTSTAAEAGDITDYAHEAGKRVDVHRPSAIDPKNYELAAPLPDVPWYKSGPFFDLGSVSGTCFHCGHAIRYATRMVYLPTGEKITFGADCTDLIDLDQDIKHRAGYEFKRLKKRAANEARALREQQTKEKNATQFRAAEPKVVEYLENLDASERNWFVKEMARTLNHYGYLTPGQTAAVQKCIKQNEEFLARKVAEALADVEPTAPLEDGRYTIVGEVLGGKWENNDFGGAFKMKVRLDSNACKVWGTVPKQILDTVDPNGTLSDRETIDALKGKRVSFVGTVKVTTNDEHFGYFSRPAQGKVL